MRIMLLAPKKKGGPHLSLLKLQKELQKQGHHVDFYASVKGFIKAQYTKEYDIIHTILPVPFNIHKTPIILNIRGNFKAEKGIRNPLAYLYPQAIKNASQIIIPSKFLKNKLKLKQAKIIPNFINEEVLKYHKTSYQIKDPIKIGMISKFHFKDKAYGTLKLAKILSKTKFKQPIELHIAGAGIYLNEVKEKIKKYKLNNIKIIFHGFTNEPYKFLKILDIQTFWSDLDNFPNVVLESMAIGIPTISNNIGAVKEFLIHKETGFIANEKTYITTLKKLIKDRQLRRTIGQASRQHAIQNYSAKPITEQFVKIYKKNLNR